MKRQARANKEKETFEGKGYNDKLERAKLFGYLLENMLEGVLILKLDSTILFANKQAAKLLGLESADEPLGKKSLSFLHPDYKDLVRKNLERVIRGGEKRLRNLYRLKDIAGKERWLETCGTRIDFKGQRADLVTFRDVTDRKKVEKALKKSERKYRNLVENMTDVIYSLDTARKITSVNKAVKAVFGFEPDEIIGRSFSEFFTKEVVPQVMSDFKRVRTGKALTAETVMIDKYGKWHNVEYSSTPIRKNGKIVGSQGIVRDITKRKKAEEALRQSAVEYGDLYDSAPVAYLSVGVDGFIKRINRATENLFGYRLKELENMKIFDLYAEESRAKAKELLERMKRGIGWENEEMIYKTKEGQKVYGLLSVSLIKDESGRIKESRSVIVDITRRKKSEEARRESEFRYHSLFENMLSGFAYCKILLDENNRPTDFVYLEVNDAFEKLTGLKRENVVGKKVSEAIPDTKESHPELFDIYGKVALTGKETKFDIYFEPLEIWLSISVYSPKKGYFVAVFDNITKRKKAQEEIKALSRFPSENPNPVVRIARDGKVIYANDAGKEVFEVRVGKKMPERYLSTLNEAVRSKQQVGLEKKVGDRYFSSVVKFIPELGYFNMYSMDVTERKKAEKALREHSENLEQMVEERTKKLRDVQEELVRSERLATLGQVSGGISHELRNPLGVIDSSAYYLKMKLKDADPKVQEHLDRIKSSVAKATGIIESLLKMTQMREPWLKELDLIAVTSKVIAAFKMPVAVKLVENFPKEELTVLIDRGQLEIVIEGIINNAIQAMGGKGTLTVGISRTADGRAEVAIADSGPGIAPDILDRIFDPLFSTKEQGIGLGLSIARAIVDKHSGSIEVKSKPGEGAIFIIRLSLHREKDKEG